MTNTEIRPQHITKPIQLLAAWLAGLAIIDGTFLTAAATITTPSWIPCLLAIAAVVNVPLFLISLFLLQTKFRPEMQEDTYYSKYLEDKYAGTVVKTKQLDIDEHIKKLTEEVVAQVSKTTEEEKSKVSKVLKESEMKILAERFMVNRSLSELYTYPNLWREFAVSWGDNEIFQEEIEALISGGLASMPGNDYGSIKLTTTGKDIAKRLESKNMLWNQNKKRNLGKRKGS